MKPHRLVGEEPHGLAGAQHGEAARLVEVGGDLGQELVGGEPDRDVMPISLSTRAAKRASALAALMPCSRSVPARSMKASSIEIGSTCGVSSSISARTWRLTRAYFSMLGGTTVACGQSFQRLEHRHRRAHAEGARDVAGGRDHAALAAADDQRLVGQGRVVALLDGGVEGVAIDVAMVSVSSSAWRRMRGEKQAGQRAALAGVAQGSRGRTRPSRRIRASQPIWPPSSGAGALDLARVDAGVLRRRRPAAARRPDKMVEHAGEEVRIARGLADRLGADAGRGQESAEPLGLAGEEGQRLRRAQQSSAPILRRDRRSWRFAGSLAIQFAFP